MFDPQFCIIDLFGHTQIAGLVSEQEIGGSSFVRVDVPETDGQKAFTRFFGPGAIYSILPVDKETGLAAVAALHVKPINPWTVQDMLKKLPAGSERADHHWEAAQAELEDYDETDDEERKDGLQGHSSGRLFDISDPRENGDVDLDELDL